MGKACARGGCTGLADLDFGTVCHSKGDGRRGRAGSGIGGLNGAFGNSVGVGIVPLRARIDELGTKGGWKIE